VALKIQFNKTALAQLKKELKVREKALPTLKAKETALRLEVKKAKEELIAAQKIYEKDLQNLAEYGKLWGEFPDDILQVKNVEVDFKKVAGVKTPVLGNVEFNLMIDSFFSMAGWTAAGIALIKESARIAIAIDIVKQRLSILEYARKKSTQKVNLYEKVQIPEYKEGILKIKRFMEDEENLEKSAQKILKDKLSQQQEAA